jgi:hypothetical protein
MKNKKYLWTFWTDQMGYKISLSELLYLTVSVEFAKKISSNLLVYTDERGLKEIQKNNIEVDTTVLNFGINKVDAPKIAEAKLLVMSLQKEPFCHIDHDTFLVKEPPQFKEFDIVTQNMEHFSEKGSAYKMSADRAVEQGISLPKELLDCIEQEDYTGYNCGYIDANNLDLIQEWTSQGLSICKSWNPNFTLENIFVEQMLLHAIVKEKKYKAGFLLHNHARLSEDASKIGYVHLMGDKTAEDEGVKNDLIKRSLAVIKKSNINTYNAFLENYEYLIEYEN